jgi:hypothetical protein
MTYLLDLSTNKLKDEDKINNAEFREKYFTMNEDIIGFTKNILETIKDNLKTEEDRETAEKAKLEEEKEVEEKAGKEKKVKKLKKNSPEKKNIYFYVGLVCFYDKYICFLAKTTPPMTVNEKLSKYLKSIITSIDKTVTKHDMKNLVKKVSEIKEKTFA